MLISKEDSKVIRIKLSESMDNILWPETLLPGIDERLASLVGMEYSFFLRNKVKKLIPESECLAQFSREVLSDFLAECWVLVQDTTFSYLALPDSVFTILCCQLAELLAKSDPDPAVTPISLLMPGVAVAAEAEAEDKSLIETVKSLAADSPVAPFRLSLAILRLKEKAIKKGEAFDTLSEILAHFTEDEIRELFSSKDTK